MIGATEGRPAGPRAATGGLPDADQERMDLLVDAIAPRVTCLAGTIFDRASTDESLLRRRVVHCLTIGLTACAQARRPHEEECRELREAGRAIAGTGGTPPALVGVHSVLILGHSEALRACQDLAAPDDLADRLEEGAGLLLQLSEEITACIEAGYTDERDARNGNGDRNRPVDALCTLITEQTNSLWRPYLTGIVKQAGLDKMFPVVMGLTYGSVGDASGAPELHNGRSLRMITAALPDPEPHTLLLCSAENTGQFLAWVDRHVAATTIYTRAVAFDEAPVRYRTTRELLPAGNPLGGGKRLLNARSLLWQRMLATQRPEYLQDYTEEVIGPILQLPADQRAALLETLDSLDRSGGSVRSAATALNVHEKTVRYRVGRIEALTGLNALSRTHWSQLHRAVQLQAMLPTPRSAGA
ncbi:PucR family transcriptional regulator [Streptomyces niger]|uniref:PucR family transcriptional regulator n=1 Tax=Streptomyces niger TaxID=66373 RepID=UPI00069C67C6|nr:helix-turn-helix domain-containing protein [Streptomyces niger]